MWRMVDKGDVLMFGYDFVYEDGPAGQRPQAGTRAVRQFLFTQAIATPLGVAHRRELWEKVGGFNEAWCEEDSDLWRRMARAGAAVRFRALEERPLSCPTRPRSRVPHITPRQKQMFLENWRAAD